MGTNKAGQEMPSLTKVKLSGAAGSSGGACTV
jgi:hypothetical protein